MEWVKPYGSHTFDPDSGIFSVNNQHSAIKHISHSFTLNLFAFEAHRPAETVVHTGPNADQRRCHTQV